MFNLLSDQYDFRPCCNIPSTSADNDNLSELEIAVLVACMRSRGICERIIGNYSGYLEWWHGTFFNLRLGRAIFTQTEKHNLQISARIFKYIQQRSLNTQVLRIIAQ